MTRYPVDKVLAKIAKEKSEQQSCMSDTEKIAYNGALALCEMWINHYICTEQFDEPGSEGQDETV